MSQAVGYRIECVAKTLLHKTLATEIDSDSVIAQIGGEDAAVSRKDVSAFGNYCVAARKLSDGFLVPFVG